MNKITNMKMKYSSMVFAIALSFVSLTSCTSAGENTDAAFQNVKDAKAMNGDSNLATDPAVADTPKVLHVKEAEKLDEWTQFKGQTEKKIQANEVLIKAIKGTPNINSKFFKKILSLEEDNNTIKRQLLEYEADEKAQRQAFQVLLEENTKIISSALSEMQKNQ